MRRITQCSAVRLLAAALLIVIATSDALAEQQSGPRERKSPLENAPAIRHRYELRDGRFELGPSFHVSLNRSLRNAVLFGARCIILDRVTGQELATLDTDRNSSAALDDNGEWLVLGEEQTVRVIEAATGRTLRRPAHLRARVRDRRRPGRLPARARGGGERGAGRAGRALGPDHGLRERPERLPGRALLRRPVAEPGLTDRGQLLRRGAQAAGRDPGGDIYLHGGPVLARDKGRADWTAGCVSVSDRDIEEIYGMIRIGTPIDILP